MVIEPMIANDLPTFLLNHGSTFVCLFVCQINSALRVFKHFIKFKLWQKKRIGIRKWCANAFRDTVKKWLQLLNLYSCQIRIRNFFVIKKKQKLIKFNSQHLLYWKLENVKHTQHFIDSIFNNFKFLFERSEILLHLKPKMFYLHN